MIDTVDRRPARPPRPEFSIYCDESTHLENDHMPFLVIGAVVCPSAKVKEVNRRLREIRERHDLGPAFELKWSRVGTQHFEFYLDVLNYFFDDDDLTFRAVVAQKAGLDHRAFGQDHDTWYFKMYYTMLVALLRRDAAYRIFLDIKDTRSGEKVRHLHDVLCSKMHDFDREIISQMQVLRSHDAPCLQIADILSGAVNYANRELTTSVAKNALVSVIRRRTRLALTRSTLQSERKFNLFLWKPRLIVQP